MNIEILIASLVQLTLGSYLLLRVLHLPKCEKLKYRFISFSFAVIGNITLITSFVYYPEFMWSRFICLTLLSLSCILFLTSQSWNIPKVCYKLQSILKGKY